MSKKNNNAAAVTLPPAVEAVEGSNGLESAVVEPVPAAEPATPAPATATATAAPARPSMSEIEQRLNAEREAARTADRQAAALKVRTLEERLAELGDPRGEWKAKYQAPHQAKVEEKRKAVQKLEKEETELRDQARMAWTGTYEPRQIERENTERELGDARRRLEALT